MSHALIIHWSIIVLAKIDLVALYRLIKSTLKNLNLKTKQWNPPSFRLFSLAFMIFQTVQRMRKAWKWKTYVPSQSFSSESAVKYLHVGRRKIQISPPLGEQDQSNALPQGQQRQSNPHPMPCLPPAGITLIGALLRAANAFRVT